MKYDVSSNLLLRTWKAYPLKKRSCELKKHNKERRNQRKKDALPY